MNGIRRFFFRFFSVRNLHNLVITAVTFMTMALLYYLPSAVQLLDPIGKALTDFALTDIVFSRLRDDDGIQADTNIVIVNLGTLPREKIAEQLQIITAQKPKVIGIDAMFRRPKTPFGDSLLSLALSAYPAIVMVSHLEHYEAETEQWLEHQQSFTAFQTQGGTGFDNVLSDDEPDPVDSLERIPPRTIRLFAPSAPLKTSDGVSNVRGFAVSIAAWFDENAVQRLFKRGTETEVINYRGNTQKFFTLDAPDIFQRNDLGFLKDKIVLLGYLGEPMGKRTAEDIFFTPLNTRFAGKTYPDMYGVVIHANIVSMILRGDYITIIPEWLSNLFAVLLCYANVILMSRLMRRYEHWYDIARLGLQFFQSLVLLIGFTLVFHYFRWQWEPSLAVAAVVIAASVHEVYFRAVHGIQTRFFSKQTKTEV